MNGRRFRVPIAICYADDLHYFRRGLIPLNQYLQDILHCWNTQRGINRFLAEREILKEVKAAGLLECVGRLRDLRNALLKHKRFARNAKVVTGKRRIQKARKVKNPTRRLDPAMKVLAVVGGSLVPCKGNHFRRRHAYRECADYGTGIIVSVLLTKQPFAHESEQHTLADETAAFSGNHSCGSVRDALKVLEWE